MLSEIDKRPYAHECGKTNYIFCPACVYAEGRKAAEKDLGIAKQVITDQCNDEKSVKELCRPFLGEFVDGDSYGATDIVSVVEKLVELLRGKGVPQFNPSFDEKEHAGLVEKGTKAWAGHVNEKGPTEKDFKELLELSNQLRKYPWITADKFDAWKKARGIE